MSVRSSEVVFIWSLVSLGSSELFVIEVSILFLVSIRWGSTVHMLHYVQGTVSNREMNTVRDRLPAQLLHLQNSDAPAVCELAFRESVFTVIKELRNILHYQEHILLYIEGLPTTTTLLGGIVYSNRFSSQSCWRFCFRSFAGCRISD